MTEPLLKISVIIPSYKPREYIWECLDSLYNQTLDKADFEIILVLNGCNEPWNSQIKNWLSTHKSLQCNFIQTDTPGVSNARNIALDAARGEYITFIDDDDYVSHEYLECLLDAATQYSVSVSDSIAFFDDTKCEIPTYTPHLAYQRNIGEKTLSILHARAIFNGPWMKLLNRSFIHGIRFDTSMSVGEDSLFMFGISKNIKRVALASPKAVYYRRYRAGSAVMTNRKVSYWIKNALRCSIKYCKIYFKDPFSYDIRLFIRILLSNIKGAYYHIVNQ